MVRYLDKGSSRVIIIGGGFFGASIAIFIKEHGIANEVIVVEQESDLLQHASYNNQARVHNGYHYPRSVLTAIRSRANLPNFVDDYHSAVDDSFDKYYAIASQFSKVSARQFYLFCQKIGAEIEEAPSSVKELFNNHYIENVFRVKEYAFNARTLKKIILNRLDRLGITVKTNTKASAISEKNGHLCLELNNGKSMEAREIYNCTYSGINFLNRQSNLPLVPLKHEFAEICLIEVPPELKSVGVTLMDGPFFSCMPFPDKGLHSLSHVRYTPHCEWQDDTTTRNGYTYSKSLEEPSAYSKMIKDVQRYMPIMSKSHYVESLWETKTVLAKSESDDSRPILFKKNFANLRGYHCVMGGKIDNIYDVFRELTEMYEKAS